MKRFLILNFLFVSIVILFSACSFNIHTGLKKIDNKKHVDFKVLGDDFKKVLYKTNIQVYRKHFSGLLFIKDMPNDSSYRVMFLSEVGMKIFDFEYLYGNNIEEDFKVHHILEPLNKKMLVKTLKSDFQLLLMNGFSEDNSKLYKNKEGKFLVKKYNNKPGKLYYFKNIETGNIEKIERCGSILKKVEVDINKYDNNRPEELMFTHKNLNLKIELKEVEQ